MTDLDKWKQLFIKGEYPDRNKVLKGLKLEDIIKKPDNMLNSIYDELWHMAVWQNNIVLNDDDDDIGDKEFKKWDGDLSLRFPKSEPKSQQEWDELVKSFLQGLEKALKWCESKDKLEEGEGFTVKDSLYSLSIHNAYHFGKIVALRQILGLWPPGEI